MSKFLISGWCSAWCSPIQHLKIIMPPHAVLHIHLGSQLSAARVKAYQTIALASLRSLDFVWTGPLTQNYCASLLKCFRFRIPATCIFENILLITRQNAPFAVKFRTKTSFALCLIAARMVYCLMHEWDAFDRSWRYVEKVGRISAIYLRHICPYVNLAAWKPI